MNSIRFYGRLTVYFPKTLEIFISVSSGLIPLLGGAKHVRQPHAASITETISGTARPLSTKLLPD